MCLAVDKNESMTACLGPKRHNHLSLISSTPILRCSLDHCDSKPPLEVILKAPRPGAGKEDLSFVLPNRANFLQARPARQQRQELRMLSLIPPRPTLNLTSRYTSTQFPSNIPSLCILDNSAFSRILFTAFRILLELNHNKGPIFS